MSFLAYHRSVLRLLTVTGGYPFAVGSDQEVKFLKSFSVRYVVGLGCFAIQGTLFLLVFMNAMDGGGQRAFGHVTSVTSIDVVSQVSGIFVSVVTSGLVVVLFTLQRQQLMEVFCSLDDISSEVNANKTDFSRSSSKSVGASTFRHVVAIFAIVNILFPATNYALHDTLFPKDDVPGLKWAFTMTGGFLMMGFVSPQFLGGFVHILMCLTRLRDCFAALCVKIADEFDNLGIGVETKQKGDIQDVHGKVLHLGKKLCNVSREVEESLTPYILLHFVNSLVSATAYTYGASIIFTSQFNVFRAICSLGYCVLATVYFYTLYKLCDSGQKFQDAMAQTRQALWSISRKDGTVMKSRLLLHEFELLVETLRDRNGMVPGKFFCINRAAFLSTVGTISTYLIILVQFKTSETF